MKRNRGRGFSLPELMISMTIFGMVTTLIVVLYHSVTVAYRHNFVRLENSDRARETFRRIVPLISSACPNGPGSAIISPAVPLASPTPGVVLTATNQFIENFVFDGPGTVPAFVPFRPLTGEMGSYRIRFLPRSLAEQNKDPARKVGDMWIDPNTAPDNTPGADDRCVARNIYDCHFQNTGSNKILVTVEVYGLDRTASNRQVLQRLTYRSEVWLPYFSNTVGN